MQGVDFEPVRIFDPQKDKLSELPIYDQLDWLIVFFTTPRYSQGGTIGDAAWMVKGMSSHTGVELFADISAALIADVKVLISQLLEDNYLTGIKPSGAPNEEYENVYKPTVKAKLAKEGLAGYRAEIYRQKSEERTIYHLRMRQEELTTSTLKTNRHIKKSNITLIVIFSLTATFALGSLWVAYMLYKLEKTKWDYERSQSTKEKLLTVQLSSELQYKDKVIHLQQVIVDSLLKACPLGHPKK